MSVTVMRPRLDHLGRMTGPYGLFEHALFSEPRLEDGYTVDDNARALVVLARSAEMADRGFEPYVSLVLDGLTPRGWHNRMSAAGEWTDILGSDDAQGRAIWGLGEMVGGGYRDELVLEALLTVTVFETHHLRALSYSILGAVAALRAGVFESTLHEFIVRSVNHIPEPVDRKWAWPEKRLTYDNARVAEALIRAGAVTGQSTTLRGLDLLHWLIEIERGENGFSFTPVGGRGRGERGPSFDQQPIEAWAMADACAAALELDGDAIWRSALQDAVLWFLGRNDVGASLYEPATGGGFDGLQEQGVNRNQGAESTLAAIASLGRLDHFGGG